MSFTIKVRGAPSRLISSEYLCPEHGRFAADVERDVAGDPPESVACPTCGALGAWVISAPLGRVKMWEVVRGGWQKPERETWLDTRELGEGMELDEFRQRRAAIRDRERRESLKELME